MRNDLGKPHEGEIAHGEQTFQPLPHHRRSPDSGKANVSRSLFFEGRQKPAAEVISRCLPSNDENEW